VGRSKSHYRKTCLCRVLTKHGKHLNNHGKGFAVSQHTAKNTRQHFSRQSYRCRVFTKPTRHSSLPCSPRRYSAKKSTFTGVGQANGRVMFAVRQEVAVCTGEIFAVC
jgi:hypothetical protein